MKITTCLSITVFLLLGGLCIAAPPGEFRPGSEPDGFRGIKWGADLSKLPEMVPDAEWDLFKAYTRLGDNLEFDSVELTNIRYTTWQGRFYEVILKTEKVPEDYYALINAIHERFGTEVRTQTSEWERGKGFELCIIGDKTTITIYYTPAQDDGRVAYGAVSIASTNILNEKNPGRSEIVKKWKRLQLNKNKPVQ
ncbi:MAG: hypothetical protein P9M08_11405 [Candidatus Erginobacter occultus]|nr:hypothetical protein [Candidatus Erginobacter occultus]